MNSFSSSVETGIAGYLRQVRRTLSDSGQPEAEAVATDLEDQIRTQLAGIKGGLPDLSDLHAVLARMDAPSAFGSPAGKPVTRSSPSARFPAGVLAGAAAVLLLVVAAILIRYAMRDTDIAAATRIPAATPADSTAAARKAPGPDVAPRIAPATEPDKTERAASSSTSTVALAAMPTNRVPVVVTTFTTTDNLADREAVSATMADGLINALSLDPRLRVVERAMLAHAMKELRMSAEGAVDQASAIKLGRITGAQVILLGNIVKLDDKLVVTARLMNPETSELSAVRVTGPRAELLTLVDDLAREITNRITKDDKGTLARRPPEAELATMRASQSAVKKAIAGKKLPRVLVMLPESHLERHIPDPAGETELVLWLTDCGFLAASPEYEGVRPPDPTSQTTSETDIAFRRNRGLRNEEGDVRVSSRVLQSIGKDSLGAERTKLAKVADVLIIGEGFSERASEREGIVSCKARLELKAIDVRSGEVLAAKSTYGAGADVAEHVAGKRALQSAGREMAIQLIPELVEKWQKLAGK